MRFVIPGFYEQEIPNRRNALKIATLVGMIVVGFFSADVLYGMDLAVWLKFPMLGAIGILNAIFVIGLGILAHDAVHGALFRHRAVNYFVGGVISAIALLPFRTNRRFHLKHHRYAHQKDLDPENFMHDRPYWQGVLLGVHLGLFIHYFGIVTHMLGIKTKLTDNLGLTWRDVLIDLAICGVTIGLFYGVLPVLFGWSLVVTSGLTILSIPFVFSWRAMADHYGLAEAPKAQSMDVSVDEDVVVDRQKTYKPISGWVVHTHPFFCWVWSNVNYHEVHHQFPWLSSEYLPKVFEETRHDIPYAELNGYWQGLLQAASRSYYH